MNDSLAWIFPAFLHFTTEVRSLWEANKPESRPTEGPFLQGPNPEKVHFLKVHFLKVHF